MTGLGSFITNGKKTPFYARKEFTVSGQVKSAYAKVCGLGQFVFFINGKKVDDHELDPGWTDYRKTVEYVGFDIKDYLKPGRNVVGVEVGNGWFIMNNDHYTFTFPGFMPPNPNPYRSFANVLMLAMEISIEYVDGTTTTVFADDSFRIKDHFITSSNVYGSETMDGRLVQDGFSLEGFNDKDWEAASFVGPEDVPKGKLKRQEHPPIKVIKRYTAKKCGEIRDREVFDLGQNISGMLQVTIKGKEGSWIKVFPAEKLKKDGDVDQVAKGWNEINTVITCIMGNESPKSFRSRFSYFAGRFLAVEKSDPDVEIIELFGDAITSAWKGAGSFKASDIRYEQIYGLVEKAVEANMVSVHTDCPTIERFAWQEPNHLMAPSIMYMKDGNSLWRKFFSDMRDSQHTGEDYFLDYENRKIPAGDGLIPSQCPCYIPNVIPVPGMGSFYDIIPWGSALILGVKWHYLFYGDRTVIDENFEAGEKYFSYLLTRVNNDGFINHGLGDWGNPDNELARENIETAFLYADAMALKYFSEILCDSKKQEMYDSYARDIKKNYNEKLLVEKDNGDVYYRSFEHNDKDIVTLATMALPMYFGLVPEDKEEGAKAVFRRLFIEKGALASGEIALPYIIQTARCCGLNDIISRYILKEEHPSYYAFVKEGLTTLGEYWEENPRSHCHDMMGHIVEWYYNGIAGIRPLTPGFTEVIIEPFLPETVNEFKCNYKSISGEIYVHVKREASNIVLEVKTSEEIKTHISLKELEKTGMIIVRI